MNDYSLTRLYELLRQDLVLWVSDNKKLRDKITAHNLGYLFEFHKRKGLSIDLCRFEKDYYDAVFHPPEDKKEVITEFVRKSMAVMQATLKRLGKDEISLTITVRNKVSSVSYWHTTFVSDYYGTKNLKQLSRKLDDWV